LKPGSRLPIEFEPHCLGWLSRSGRIELYEHSSIVTEQFGDPSQQHVGCATDTKVSVEQQRRSPASGSGHVIEHRAMQHGGAIAAGSGDGGR